MLYFDQNIRQMKNINLYLLTILLSSTAFLTASAQLTNWMKTGNGSGEGQGYDVVKDASGNVYTTGRFAGSANWGGQSATSNGSDDMFLAKYDAQGAIQWVRSGGTSNSDWGYAVTTDNAGSVYVTGWFWGTTNFGPAFVGNSTLTSTSNDVFLLKYSASGDLIWAKQFGSNGGEYPSELATDNSGNIYMSGHFTSSFMVGSNQLVNGGGYDVFLIKFDSSGTPAWSKRAGGTGNENATFIGVNDGNEVVMGGRFTGNTTLGATTATSAGDYDFFVAKFDNSGNISWAKTGGGSAFDNVECVYISNTAIYVGGRFESPSFTFNSHTFTSNGGADALMMKFDNSGTMLWANSFGGSGFDQALGMCIAASYIYVGGEMQTTVQFPGGKTLTSNGNSDAFYACYDKNGNFINAANFGGTAYDAIQNMYSGVNEGTKEVYVTGEYGSGFTLDGNTYNNSGLSDVFTASLDTFGVVPATGVKLPMAANNEEITVYPNPGKGYFYLQSDVQLGNPEIVVTDIAGKVILSKQFETATSINFNLDGNTTGIYFITLKTAEINRSFKLILQ